MAESKVTFEGTAPFALPVAQSGTVRAVSDTVEMTLYHVLPEHGPKPKPVRTLMTAAIARQLAEGLVQASLIVEAS